jgi:membrane-associated phospholipid phosphatase
VTEEVIDGELRQNNWRSLRRACAIAYFTVLLLVVIFDGVPTARTTLMSIIVVGLGISSIGYGWRRLLRVVLDWLPFTVVLMVYDLSRGLANTVSMPLHEHDIASAESRLFGGSVPTVWLQHHLYSPHTVHWYDAVATLVYTTHFLATPMLAAVLWLRNRDIWVAYITRVIALSFAGLVTYVLFPEAPPWLAARDGFIDPVSRLSARGWIWMHAGHVQHLLDAAQRDGSNPVAAMPSLHTAFAAMIALFLAARMTSRWRHLLWLYPIAMGLVLIYTGEHYALDILAGIAYAIVVHAVVTRWETGRISEAKTAALEPIAVH